MNLKKIKGSEKLDEIMNAKKYPQMKIGLGYEGEPSKKKFKIKIPSISSKHLHIVMTTEFRTSKVTATLSNKKVNNHIVTKLSNRQKSLTIRQ